MKNCARPSDFLRAGNRGVLPKELATGKMGVMEETSETVLAEKLLPEKSPALLRCRCTTKRQFFSVDIPEDVVKLVTRKLSGSKGPGGTDPEALKGWT